jgi:transcriptional regulator of acetoin/glycerol metabolism
MLGAANHAAPEGSRMPVSDFRIVHTRQLWQSFVEGGQINDASLPSYVYRAWCDCRRNGINPRHPMEAMNLPKNEFNVLLREYKELIEIAKPVVEMIMFSTNTTKFIVMITSKDGVILNVAGDLSHLSVQENYYNRPGVYCGPDFFGTRATTLALREKKPISLCGSEHYLEVFHNSLCYAAPIFDHKGDILACVSLACSLQNFNQTTLAMVSVAANNITSQLLRSHLDESRNYLNSMVYAICGALPDGIVALDNENNIKYVNHAGEDIFESNAVKLKGKNVSEFFDEHCLKELLYQADTNKKGSVLVSMRNKKEHKWLCRTQPLNDAMGKPIGKTLFLASERQIVQGITQVGGNRAHYSLDDIRGESPQLKHCVQLARKIAKKASRILITGESGTGKELFAQGIHNAGPRHAQPFVAISCASIPRDLIEAELFGYVSGSFTGANKNGAVGKFELAQNGTLFLDEIGSLPMEAQGKLLRVLQQSEIVRIGGKLPIPVNVNVISANNVSLHELVKARMFREDLLYRLNSVELVVPPLRERTGDAELLILHFIGSLSRAQGRKVKISSEWLGAMLAHPWQGNVRELEHACETALILCDEDVLTEDHLPHSISGRTEDHSLAGTTDLCESLDENFRKWLVQALESCNGNLSTMTKRHDISRSTLYRKMKQFDIDIGAFRSRRKRRHRKSAARE